MGRTITVDYDSLVSLLKSFYNQGYDDAGNTPAPLDMTEDAVSQLTILELQLIENELFEADHLEHEKLRQHELDQAMFDMQGEQPLDQQIEQIELDAINLLFKARELTKDPVFKEACTQFLKTVIEDEEKSVLESERKNRIFIDTHPY